MPLPLPVAVTMRGVIDRCALMTYRTPVESAERFVPGGLRLRTKAGFAFWNVVVCHVHRMRPWFAPEKAGLSYHHVAYRLLVEGTRDDGERMSGLYFVRSDADSSLIGLGGNAMSDFRFNPAVIDMTETDARLTVTVRSRDSVGNADVTMRDASAGTLAHGSPFESLGEARSFLKYTPLGVSPSGRATKLRLAEVFRDERAWREYPLTVERAFFAFFHNAGQKAVRLELAQRIEPIEYRWRLGKSVRLAAETGSVSEAMNADEASGEGEPSRAMKRATDASGGGEGTRSQRPA